MLRQFHAPPLQAATKALRHPERALLRLILLGRIARRKEVRERNRLIRFLTEESSRTDPHTLYREYMKSEFAESFRTRRRRLDRGERPHRLGTTPAFGCEALHLAVRVIKPRVVVETGVLYGASSAHILDALDRNGEGTLYSIDLGCDPYEPPHDFFVPSRLQERWRLILGDSRKRLPVLLRQLGTIDHFHHDSLHTAEHMHWEFETAFAHLPIGGVLTSDDVLVSHSLREIGRPNAFAEFCRSKPVRWATFGNVGIAVKLDL